MAYRPEMYEPTRGFFEDGRFNETMQNVAGPTLVATFWLGAKIQSPTGLSVYNFTLTVGGSLYAMYTMHEIMTQDHKSNSVSRCVIA